MHFFTNGGKVRVVELIKHLISNCLLVPTNLVQLGSICDKIADIITSPPLLSS